MDTMRFLYTALRLSLLMWVATTLAIVSSGAMAPWHSLQLSREESVAMLYRRKDNPFISMIAGTILAIMAISLLWLNEGHAVRMEHLLALVRRRVRSVQPQAMPENERHPIFLAGEASTGDRLVLPEWGHVNAPPNSAKLRAMAFMYQWEQEKKDNTVNYVKRWKHHRVESRRFQESGYENPLFPVAPTCLALAKVNLGDFILSKKMLGKLQNYQPCDIDSVMLEEICAHPRMRDYGEAVRTTFSMFSSFQEAPSLFFPYRGNSGPTNPSIGDLMLIIQYVPCGPLSLLGLQVPCEAVHAGQELLPGSRCSVAGRPAELMEVTPPPKQLRVHFVDTGSPDENYVDVKDATFTQVSEPWEVGPHHWTFAPVQFTQSKSIRPTFVRAFTGNTNLQNAMGEYLLGESEEDFYIEEARSVRSHLEHGKHQVLKMMQDTICPTSLASAFLAGSSPDEICIALEQIYTAQDAIEIENQTERRVNNGVRLFGFFLMWVSFNEMLRPLTWIFSFGILWYVGFVVLFVLHAGTFFAALCCSGCTIGTAWLAFRPTYAIPLLVGPLAILYIYDRLAATGAAPRF